MRGRNYSPCSLLHADSDQDGLASEIEAAAGITHGQ
jgi:hypothetical protein